MLTRMTRMARMSTHMLTRMTRWLAGSLARILYTLFSVQHLRHHAFLYFSLPSLHDYDVKMRDFRLYGGRSMAHWRFWLSPSPNLSFYYYFFYSSVSLFHFIICL